MLKQLIEHLPRLEGGNVPAARLSDQVVRRLIRLKFFRVVKTALSRERTGRTLLRG